MSGVPGLGNRAQTALCGTAVVSIDLELDVEHHQPELARRLDEVRARLVAATREAQIPATFAVADPLYSAASESILSSGCGHEVAVLGDEAWLGPGCGRERLARELSRRFSASRKAGMAVSTLVLRNVEQAAELDLLIDHGVKAVAGPPVPSPLSARLLAPAVARFGVWQAPPPWQLGPVTTWWSPAAWSWRREIKRAIRGGTTTHLRLSALQLIDAKPHALETVHALFRYLAQRRDSGRLRIATISDLAAAALQQRAGTPSRSVLRPAA